MQEVGDVFLSLLTDVKCSPWLFIPLPDKQKKKPSNLKTKKPSHSLMKMREIPFLFLIAQEINGNVLCIPVHYYLSSASKNKGFMLSQSTDLQFS